MTETTHVRIAVTPIVGGVGNYCSFCGELTFPEKTDDGWYDRVPNLFRILDDDRIPGMLICARCARELEGELNRVLAERLVTKEGL